MPDMLITRGRDKATLWALSHKGRKWLWKNFDTIDNTVSFATPEIDAMVKVLRNENMTVEVK